MTVITRISKTRKGRFALFSEEGFLFSVDDETLAKSGIVEGFSVSDGELSLLKDASDTHAAREQGLRYLALRAYSEQELYRKLCLKYDEETAAAAMAELLDLGLLDDREFARAKAEGLAARGKSRGEISRQLVALGVSREVAAAALAGLEADDAATALAILQKNYMGKLARGERQKVMAALARRGFSGRDIRAAIEAAEAELDGELENGNDTEDYDNAYFHEP